jgi:hypothetical protein
MPISPLFIVVLMSFLLMTAVLRAADGGIAVVPNEAQRRVDVTIDGRPFTSYIWPDSLKVPVLYPLRTAGGTPITRGFPLEPRVGERVDHPHHAGLWLNYGNVNGVDFWNNSTFVSAEQAAKMGTVVHKRIIKAVSSADKGELEVQTDWIMPDGSTVIKEHASFTFRAGPHLRSVDRVSVLTAQEKPVSLKDDKEGMLGLRVRKELEQPTQESVPHVGADGKPTTQKSIDNTGVSGQYRTSEGKTGDAAWGTRGRWTMLSGKVGDEPITVAILDHPNNVGFPTYWHARGYGLFAANPLGQAELSGNKERLNYSLQPNQSTTFKYRLIILDQPTTPEQIEAQYQRWVAEVK